MCVLAQIERTVNTLAAPIVANGLGDGENVGFRERAVEGGAAVTAGAEADELVRVREVGLTVVIVALELVEVDQQLGGRGLSG